MSRTGRNQPCPCGSGRKSKRCCEIRRGPGEDDLARAYVAQETRAAARVLAGLDDEALRALWNETVELPGRDLGLVLPLPALISPQLQQLLDAVADDDPDQAEPVLEPILAGLDTPATRAALTRGLVRLADDERIERTLAAAAIVDLGSGSRAFLRASLIEAAAISSGAARTPGGLLIAA